MNSIKSIGKRRGVKLTAAAIGAAAAVASAALTVALDGGGSRDSIMLAGSGHAPTNTVYTQPAVSQMTVGATLTTTTPPSVPETTDAKPAIKAGS